MPFTPPQTLLSDWPDQARIWCYVADRTLDTKQILRVTDEMDSFVRQWTAHSRALRAYQTILFDRVLVLGVDQSVAGASGCSIDTSVRAVQTLGEGLGVDFFNRMIFLTYHSAPASVEAYAREAFAAAYAAGDIDDTTLVVDPLVETVAQARQSLLKPLGESWHRRMV